MKQVICKLRYILRAVVSDLLAVSLLHQISFMQKLVQQLLSQCLIPSYQCFTLTLLPAVTVSCRRCDLQLAVVTFVTNFGALRAAAQRASKSTCFTFINILTGKIGVMI